MKIIVTLAVVALLIVAAFFFFSAGSTELDIVPKQTPSVDGTNTANVKQDYSALSNLLAQDMAKIPLSLDGPRVAPNNAFSVKSRLAGANTLRSEYQTLTQVCDLIIFADQEHSVRQAQTQQAEQGVSGDLMANARTNQLTTTTTRTSLHARAQTDWEAYRQQTNAEVHRLLATLPGSHS